MALERKSAIDFFRWMATAKPTVKGGDSNARWQEITSVLFWIDGR